ncbi:MAG TPA: M28 family peptidase [Bryobacteraceae bacterium]|nr:M28 family peptidase [Bryobacteraceae bacterium]
MTPEVRAALEHIRADSLRGDLSFLASDLLEGRDTPSRGLDLAAEYIAAQFRRAGLEPGGDNGYFQTAHMLVVTPTTRGFALRLSHGNAAFSAQPSEASFRISDALDLAGAPVFKLDAADAGLIEKLTAADVENKVVIVEYDPRLMTNLRAAMVKLRQWKPPLIILVDPTGVMARGGDDQRVVDPGEPENSRRQVTLRGRAAAEFYASLKPGLSGAVATVHIDAPESRPVTLHNVVAVLRGSDPQLRDTCILLTAHYDHLGMRPDGDGDRIFNGANDDGSGTVSVLEVARVLAQLNPRPRRSIVFVTFFGEEKGLIGSRFYARHPVWPLEKTIAQLNLEQVGRTDSTEGKQINNATLTGFDFTSLTGFVRRAGELTGIKVYKNGRNSDPYFSASDNLSLAQVGVPAETLTVAFDFPDYHRPGDEWQKIDYGNMAKVDRAVALSLVMLADSTQTPEWNAEDPKTAPYVRAWREHHP